MGNMTVENIDTGNVVLEDGTFDDETLNVLGATKVLEGTILARNNSTKKLVPFFPGGQASVPTIDGPFVMTPGMGFWCRVNGLGFDHVVFDAAGGHQDDTTDYATTTPAVLTDTTVYPVANQIGLTVTINTNDPVNGPVSTLVTFAHACTTALLVASEINAQVPHVSADGTSGQVVVTTDEGGDGTVISVTAGTSALTFAAPVAGTGALVDEDGLVMTVAVDGGAPQVVTFAGGGAPVTRLAQVIAAINLQTTGCLATNNAGQLLVTSLTLGHDSRIAMVSTTANLTYSGATDGTGDVGNIAAVTAAEVETVVEADAPNIAVTVSGLAAILSSTYSIEIFAFGGTALAALGIAAGAYTPDGNGEAKALMTYQKTCANGDNAVRVMKSGKVRTNKICTQNGATITEAIKDQLRACGIIPVDVSELCIADNQ